MNKKPKIFISLDEPLVIRLIESAMNHVVFVAPSISLKVATALVERTKKNPILNVDVVLDPDTRSLRLGYGELGGLNTLHKNGIEIRFQPELRIGVLVVDDRSWIFAPTPEIILEPAEATTFNAINVNQSMTNWLRHAVTPQTTLVDLVRQDITEVCNPDDSPTEKPDARADDPADDGVLDHEVIDDPASHASSGDGAAAKSDVEPENGADDVLEREIIGDTEVQDTEESQTDASAEWTQPEIGQQTLGSEEVEKINEEIEKRPPKQFDEAREILVYNGHLQFVDFKFSGGRLSSRRVRLPKHLLKLVDDPSELLEIEATCKMFDEPNKLIPEIYEFEQVVNYTRRIFTQSLGESLGSVILQRNRKAFDTEIGNLQNSLQQLTKLIQKKLTNAINARKSKLIAILEPTVMQNPPAGLQKMYEYYDDPDEALDTYLRRELGRIFPDAWELVEKMEIQCVFKDVTWEMLNETKFGAAIKAKFPDEGFTKLYLERKTIGERKEKKPRTVSEEDWPDVIENEPS